MLITAVRNGDGVNSLTCCMSVLHHHFILEAVTHGPHFSMGLFLNGYRVSFFYCMNFIQLIPCETNKTTEYQKENPRHWIANQTNSCLAMFFSLYIYDSMTYRSRLGKISSPCQ